jgi:hypothetical protein
MLGGALDTNPRRTAQREWRGMNWAEKEARARHFYNQTWRRVAALYGQAGKPPPDVRFGGAANAVGVSGYTYSPTYMNGGPGYIDLNTSMVGALARPKFGYPKWRADAREKVMHELAHYYQDPQVFNDPNTNHREEAAQLFATYWAHKLFGADPMSRSGPLPYGNRPAASRDLASAYGRAYPLQELEEVRDYAVWIHPTTLRVVMLEGAAT